jgi:hypothetical protein
MIIKSSGHRHCDDKCYNATGSHCTCICGGVNHGKGLSKAVNDTKEIGQKILDFLPVIKKERKKMRGYRIKIRVEVEIKIAGENCNCDDRCQFWSCEPPRCNLFQTDLNYLEYRGTLRCDRCDLCLKAEKGEK